MANKVTLQEGLEHAVKDSITEVVQPFSNPLKYFILPPGISSRLFGFNLISYLYQWGNLEMISVYLKKKKGVLEVDVNACVTSPSNTCGFKLEGVQNFLL